MAQSLSISEGVQTYASLANTTVTMTGKSELRITGTTNPISASTIHLNSPDAWFLMTGIRPAAVSSSYLGQIRVNGAAAVSGTNVRVVQYALGTVVIPHAPAFQPLQTFSGPSFSGASKPYSQYTYYNTASALGAMHRDISSFKLKRGYMATFSTSPNGTGPSKVYVAQDTDLDVGILPSNLDNAIQFVRVFPWRWVSKKGSCDVAPATLDATWYYNWNNNQTSALNHEYVPIRQQRYWPGLPTNQPESMHLLGFNEPDNPVEDAYTSLDNGSVDTAIAVWPELLASGLRVGAPAVTDGGTAWLYSFMDKAAAANLRVDYVPVHFYRANYTAQQLYDWLKAIHDRTGKPIWVTEFNNGANWTAGADPTYAQNATRIGEFIEMMDNAPFVERYAVYSNVEAVRNMVYAEGGLTPAGVVYRDNVSPIGYVQEVIPASSARRIARYPLEGNTLDVSGYNNHGQAVGNPPYVAGKNGQSMQFDGISSAVRLPDNLANSSNFSFAAWIYWEGGAHNQCVFDFGDDGTKTMYLMPSHSASSKMRFAIRNNVSGGSQIIEAPAALAIGSWQHVAVTMAGTTAKIYLGGAQVATGNLTTATVFDTGNNFLGKSQTAANPLFKGRLDDVFIGDYALSAAQIAALPGNTPPQFSSPTLSRGPIARNVPMSGTLAGSATDADAGDTLSYAKVSGPAWLGIASDGTLSGTPTFAEQGAQEFVVRATDARGAAASAVLNLSFKDFYWRGDLSSAWNANAGGNTNWSTSATANVDPGVLPDASSDVIFAIGASTTLGDDFTIRSLSVTSTAPVTIGGANDLTLGANGIAIAAGAGSTTLNSSGAVILGASQTWTNNSTNPLSVTSPINGAAGLTKAGSGALTLTGTNLYSGGTIISAGALQLGNGGASGSIIGNIANNGALVVNRSSDLLLDGVISGLGELSKFGAGRLTLSGANSYSGGTNLGTGQGAAVLRAAANNALGTGPLAFDGAGNSSSARLELTGGITLPNDISLPQRNNTLAAIQNVSGANRLSGSIALTVGGGNAIFQSDTGKLTLGAISSASGARTATLTGAGDGAVTGTVANGTGTVALTKTGAGTWILSGANTYTGATTLSAGTLATSGADERIANASNFILSGGIFAPGVLSETLGALTLTSATTSRLNFGAAISTLRFTSLAAGSGTLDVLNYTPNNDRLFVGNSNALAPEQLAQIVFNIAGAKHQATQLTSGEIVPALSPVAASGLIVSEFRFHGTTSADEYVEVYNTQNAPLNVGGWFIRTNTGTAASPLFQVARIPEGTVIPARGHFLFTGASYTLGSYSDYGSDGGPNASNPPQAVVSIGGDAAADSGVALYNAAGEVQDAVGFTTSATAPFLLREGAGLAAAPHLNGQYAWMRDFNGALPKDTSDPAADWVLVATDGAPVSGIAATDGTTALLPAQLGSPHPESLSSPTLANEFISTALLDPLTNQNLAPNRVRTGSGDAGNLLIRRTLKNNSAQRISKIRLLVTRISGKNSPSILANQADVRLMAQPTEIVSVQGLPVSVYGTMQEAPSAATSTSGTAPNLVVTGGGGGLGSSLAFDLVLAAPLEPRQERNYAFNLQVAKSGNFLVVFNFLAVRQP